MPPTESFKVILLGDSGVGKSAVVERVAKDVFTASHEATVGVHYTSVPIAVGERTRHLELWDTAGQEVFRSLVGFYSRDAKGVFLLYDVTKAASFADLNKWITFLRDNAPDAPVIMFANKTDLGSSRAIGRATGQEFAERNDLLYFEGSAKTGENVRDAFDRMAELVAATGDPDADECVDLSAKRRRKKRRC
jgi:small GTP-binding protein